MATSADFMEYVCEQLSGAGEMRGKKMFGEYGLYCDGKLVGLVCDNQFFLKPTLEAEQLLRERDCLILAPPYEGAGNSFLIESLEDRSSWPG
jgi:TfoX/Sxy family transcriptional regulator of competence genes